MGQQVRDLEDEITALQEENTRAGRHSREAATERQQNRLVSAMKATLLRLYIY